MEYSTIAAMLTKPMCTMGLGEADELLAALRQGLAENILLRNSESSSCHSRAVAAMASQAMQWLSQQARELKDIQIACVEAAQTLHET